RFASLGLKQVPGTGLLPAVVPGSFDAWMLLLRDYGTWTLADILAPAIGYAENGYPVLPRVAASILAAKDFFTKEWPSSAAVWLPHGEVPRPRALHRTPETAATYRRIVAEAQSAGSDRQAQIEKARDTYYRGFVAEAVDRFYRTELMDSTGLRNSGFLRGDDLALYRARFDDTVSRRSRDGGEHPTRPGAQVPVELEVVPRVVRC